MIRLGKSRFALLALLLAAVGLAFWLGSRRLHIEADVTAALPQDDGVVTAARQIMQHHPNLESMVVDLSYAREGRDLERLVDAAKQVEQNLLKSGLVIKSETGQAVEGMAWLMPQISSHLPLFFNQQQLSREIAPHLKPDKIKKALKQAQARLVELGGVGQARFIANDPLNLTSLVLKKLSLANPLPGASLEQGFLLSPDRKHLLLVFKPNAPPGDTKAALKLSKYMQGLQAEFASQISKAAPIRLVYVGAFRAALDNETIIRKDTERALLLVSIGLLLLVLCCFRRPWVGALALVPAVAGVFLATLAYSLFQSSIMAIAMGFGGALIAVAVDHGLAYVLLLDRSFDTKGGTVSHELWKIASFPVFTTVGALLVLTLSGIPLFKEVGLFAALGVGLAAFFVHVFFPLAFPSLKGTQRRSFLPVGRFMDRMVRGASWARLAVAVALALVLACFIRFDFQADLNSMNTVTPATRQAEQIVNNTWGSLFERTYIMAQGADQQALRDRANRLGDFLTSQKASNKLSGPLPLIVLLPGPQRQAANLTAWKTFWTPKRVGTLRNDLRQAAQDTGFTPQAFSGFLKLVDQPIVSSFEIPPELFGFLGVTPREA